jgi:tRNA pseudouridine38-40 synthase
LSRKVRIVVEYDGTDFAGWQQQRGQRTVQATLEDAIHEMTGERVFVRGAGRTDAGVHADGQVASLTFEANGVGIPTLGLLRGLNTVLPPDVAIVDVADVAPEFDARFSAHGKIYRYTVFAHPVRSPRRLRRAWHVREPVNLDPVRRAAELLVGEHDFAAFRASDCDRRTTKRLVRRLDITADGPEVSFEIEATAFLKNMVRIIVGTLVDIGRGRLPEDTIARMFASSDRTIGGMTAPPQGLTLVRVIY